MREILSPFRQKKTLLHMGLCALIFVGMAVPFKVMVLVEGFTEVRPVNAVPVVVGLLFGPAGAWGCAIGNLIADLFGTFSLASILGFVGNFIAAYLPYRLWHIWRRGEKPNVKSGKNLALYFVICAISALSVAIFITCGLDVWLGLWMPDVFRIIFFNDFAFPLVIGLPALIVLTSDDFRIKAYVPETHASRPETSVSVDSGRMGERVRSQVRSRIRKSALWVLIASQLGILVMILRGLAMSTSPAMSIMGGIHLVSLLCFLMEGPGPHTIRRIS
jgi:energy-coupling factor transport system substrate-specific component